MYIIEHMKTFTPTDKDWPSLMRVNPILDWGYSDLWTIIQDLEIPYCSLYNRG